MTKLILKNNMLIMFGGHFLHSLLNDGTSLWKLSSIQLDYSKKSQQPTGWEFLMSSTPKENPEDGFNIKSDLLLNYRSTKKIIFGYI